MLKPFNDLQIPADVLYLSMRAAALATFDLMKLHFGPQEVEVTGRGPLESISVLRGTAIQIQLQTLASTWARLQPEADSLLTDVDLCVCYCATVELARQTDLNRDHHISRLKTGPRSFPNLVPLWIASRLRVLQLTWPFLQEAGHLLRSGRLLNDQIDQAPAVSDGDQLMESFLALLSQWHVTPNMVENTHLLFTRPEQDELKQFFARYPRLMNL